MIETGTGSPAFLDSDADLSDFEPSSQELAQLDKKLSSPPVQERNAEPINDAILSSPRVCRSLFVLYLLLMLELAIYVDSYQRNS
jgi:hypothetical protein